MNKIKLGCKVKNLTLNEQGCVKLDGEARGIVVEGIVITADMHHVRRRQAAAHNHALVLQARTAHSIGIQLAAADQLRALFQQLNQRDFLCIIPLHAFRLLHQIQRFVQRLGMGSALIHQLFQRSPQLRADISPKTGIRLFVNVGNTQGFRIADNLTDHPGSVLRGKMTAFCIHDEYLDILFRMRKIAVGGGAEANPGSFGPELHTGVQ
jgi:hypothetical protein